MAPKVLFSEVEGVVTRDGKPVKDARVEREYLWAWNDSRGSDHAVTDATGTFSLPRITGKTFLGGLLPHEPIIEQTIRIVVDDQSFEGWIFTKRNYDQNGELGGRPIRLRCDLGREPALTETGVIDQGFFGVCTLDPI